LEFSPIYGEENNVLRELNPFVFSPFSALRHDNDRDLNLSGEKRWPVVPNALLLVGAISLTVVALRGCVWTYHLKPISKRVFARFARKDILCLSDKVILSDAQKDLRHYFPYLILHAVAIIKYIENPNPTTIPFEKSTCTSNVKSARVCHGLYESDFL